MLNEQSLLSFNTVAQLLGRVDQLGTWTTLLDIVLVATIFYCGYRLVRETRALSILYGILILALIYLLGQYLHLTTLNFLLNSVFTVLLVAIPVVFQPELRAALERLGRGEIVRSILASPRAQTSRIIGELVAALIEMSRERTGALIVIERQTGLKDLIESGVLVDALVTTQLVRTIFHVNTPLHDGAVIIRGDRVVAANVFLPLAEGEVPSSLGTRHRAALGLSRQSDAVVLVVSEETGRISIAHGEEIQAITQAEVERRLKLLLAQRRRKDA